MSPTTTRAEREPVRTTLPKATRFEDLLSTRRGRCTATALLRAARATLLPAAFAISWLAPAPRRARVPRFAGHSSAAAGCACRHETRSLAWRHHSRRTPAELPLGRVAGATPRIALCRPIRARFDWRLTLLLAIASISLRRTAELMRSLRGIGPGGACRVCAGGSGAQLAVRAAPRRTSACSLIVSALGVMPSSSRSRLRSCS